jgi:hypothetical protein
MTNRYLADSTFSDETRDELTHPHTRIDPDDEEDEGDWDDDDEQTRSRRQLHTGGQVAFYRPAVDEIVTANTVGVAPSVSVLSQPITRFLRTMAGVAESTLDAFMNHTVRQPHGPGINELYQRVDMVKAALNDDGTLITNALGVVEGPAGITQEMVDERGGNGILTRSGVMVLVVQAAVYCATEDELPDAISRFAINWPPMRAVSEVMQTYNAILGDIHQPSFPMIRLRNAGVLVPDPRQLRAVIDSILFNAVPWTAIVTHIKTLLMLDRQLDHTVVPVMGELERLTEAVAGAIDEAYSLISSAPAVAAITKEGLIRSDETYVKFARLCGRVLKRNEVYGQSHFINPKIGEMLEKEVRTLKNQFMYMLNAGPPIRWE